jgi:serine/threonine protein kinase
VTGSRAGALADGRYRLERVLGTGGMASVHLARDEELGRPVAIKLLSEGLSADPTFRARFVREAKLAARLSHPNVVSVFDTGEHEGRPFIVMECVQGETVAEIVQRRGRLPVDEALELARQAAAGLAHAHAAGLVHRDVKPQNLLVAGDGTLKVADFGIARAAELTELTEAGMVLGTAAYLAPEQAAGERVTAATDVYGLGAVVYELLTGRPPRRVESLDDLARISADEPIVPVRELRPDVSPEIEAAVMRALALRPEYRQTNAAELAAELEPSDSVARSDELEPEAETVALRAPARQRPGRRAWAVAAAVLVAALAVAGALWSRAEEPPAAPPPVEPVRPGATPEQGARNLADWLRAHARTAGGG